MQNDRVGISFPTSLAGGLYREHAFARHVKSAVAKKVKSEVQSGAPECNFFARVASRQITGQPAVETDDPARARPRAAPVAFYIALSIASAEESRGDAISSRSCSGRCSHRRQKVQRTRKREKEWKRMREKRTWEERRRKRGKGFLLIELRTTCVY